MPRYRLKIESIVELEIETAFAWYEAQQLDLGREFLEQLRIAFTRIQTNPLAYQVIRSDIRRALTRQFPYAIYFVVENASIVVFAILHTARDPQEWQLDYSSQRK